jgi:hypothetical protein
MLVSLRPLCFVKPFCVVTVAQLLLTASLLVPQLSVVNQQAVDRQAINQQAINQQADPDQATIFLNARSPKPIRPIRRIELG